MKITRCLTAVLLCLALSLCAASFALAADIRPLETDPAAVDPDNGEFRLTIKDLDRIENGGWFTAALYLEDRYGAAEIESLAPGDTILVNRQLRTVKEITVRKERSDYEVVFEEQTEGFDEYIALWKQLDGTYMALIDDWCPVTPVAEKKITLPLPDRFALVMIEAGEKTAPVGRDEFIRCLTEYGWEMTAYNTSAVFENGELVRVTHSGYPQGPKEEEPAEAADASPAADGTPVWKFCHGRRDGLETAVISCFTIDCEAGPVPGEISPEEAEDIRALAISGMITKKANDLSVTGGTWVYSFETPEGEHLLSVEMYGGLIVAADGMYGFVR